jgi:hypothetical protein
MVREVTNRGVQLLKNNRILRNHLPTFAVLKTFSGIHELTLQSGAEMDIKIVRPRQEERP